MFYSATGEYIKNNTIENFDKNEFGLSEADKAAIRIEAKKRGTFKENSFKDNIKTGGVKTTVESKEDIKVVDTQFTEGVSEKKIDIQRKERESTEKIRSLSIETSQKRYQDSVKIVDSVKKFKSDEYDIGGNKICLFEQCGFKGEKGCLESGDYPNVGPQGEQGVNKDILLKFHMSDKGDSRILEDNEILSSSQYKYVRFKAENPGVGWRVINLSYLNKINPYTTLLLGSGNHPPTSMSMLNNDLGINSSIPNDYIDWGWEKNIKFKKLNPYMDCRKCMFPKYLVWDSRSKTTSDGGQLCSPNMDELNDYKKLKENKFIIDWEKKNRPLVESRKYGSYKCKPNGISNASNYKEERECNRKKYRNQMNSSEIMQELKRKIGNCDSTSKEGIYFTHYVSKISFLIGSTKETTITIIAKTKQNTDIVKNIKLSGATKLYNGKIYQMAVDSSVPELRYSLTEVVLDNNLFQSMTIDVGRSDFGVIQNFRFTKTNQPVVNSANVLNFSISSIQIPFGFIAEVYSGKNFTGEKLVLTGPKKIGCLSHLNWDNKISSMKVLASSYHLYQKYYDKWPHCENIRCPRTTLGDMKKQCIKEGTKCNGFSFSKGVNTDNGTGWGCLKKSCVNDGSNGFGKGSHGYWEVAQLKRKKVKEENKAALGLDSFSYVGKNLMVSNVLPRNINPICTTGNSSNLCTFPPDVNVTDIAKICNEIPECKSFSMQKMPDGTMGWGYQLSGNQNFIEDKSGTWKTYKKLDDDESKKWSSMINQKCSTSKGAKKLNSYYSNEVKNVENCKQKCTGDCKAISFKNEIDGAGSNMDINEVYVKFESTDQQWGNYCSWMHVILYDNKTKKNAWAGGFSAPRGRKVQSKTFTDVGQKIKENGADFSEGGSVRVRLISPYPGCSFTLYNIEIVIKYNNNLEMKYSDKGTHRTLYSTKNVLQFNFDVKESNCMTFSECTAPAQIDSNYDWTTNFKSNLWESVKKRKPNENDYLWSARIYNCAKGGNNCGENISDSEGSRANIKYLEGKNELDQFITNDYCNSVCEFNGKKGSYLDKMKLKSARMCDCSNDTDPWHADTTNMEATSINVDKLPGELFKSSNTEKIFSSQSLSRDEYSDFIDKSKAMKTSSKKEIEEVESDKVKVRIKNDKIQWSPKNKSDWTDLMNVEDITSDSFKKTTIIVGTSLTNIRWKFSIGEDTEWKNLEKISNLVSDKDTVELTDEELAKGSKLNLQRRESKNIDIRNYQSNFKPSKIPPVIVYEEPKKRYIKTVPKKEVVKDENIQKPETQDSGGGCIIC